jgi:hypothetical protein
MSINRRGFLAGSIVTTISATSGHAQQRRLFDGHCHIIDHRFPIVANQGYTPFRSTPTWRRRSRLALWPVQSYRGRSRPTIKPI